MVDEKMKYEIQEEIIPSQSFHWPISVSEEGMNLPFWVNAVGIDTYKKHFYLKREGYPDYQLLYVMEGNLDVTYAKNTFTMEAADMVLVHHKPFTTIKTGDKGYAKLAFIHTAAMRLLLFTKCATKTAFPMFGFQIQALSLKPLKLSKRRLCW